MGVPLMTCGSVDLSGRFRLWTTAFGAASLSVVGSSVGVMFDVDLAAADGHATLDAAVEARAVSDAADVRLLSAAARWADLHGEVETLESGAALPGLERLVQLGGDGTPEVAEFAAAELAAVLGMSTWAGQRLVADALDLRHRLPRLWGRVVAGEVRPWIARQVAERSRSLSVEAVAVVDRKAARYGNRLTGSRLQGVIDAAVLAADPDQAQADAEAAERGQGVWVNPSTDAGTRDVFIRTDAASAIWFDAAIDRIADGLGLLGDESSKDTRRGRAVGVLARPQQTLDLYGTVADLTRSGDDPGAGSAAAGAGTVPSRRSGVDSRPPVTLYVHLTDATLTSGTGVARIEGIGPVLAQQVRGWLTGCAVTVKPVIDLNDQVPVDAYEIPDRLREATQLRSPVDVFPYATNTSRRRDLDHTIPWRPPDRDGPPGQTRLDNLAPMTRFHHRIKTHSNWQVAQPFNGVFVWRTPHGHHYLVDNTGTRPPQRPAAADTSVPHPA